jgi:SRSO17 transposase
MALEMLKAAHESEMPFSWVTADCVYGDFTDIRLWLESIEKSYVMAVSGKAYVWKEFEQYRISEILKTLPEEGWKRLSAGKGSKGERYYDCLSIPINSPEKENWRRCLLIRRSIEKPDKFTMSST